MSWVVLMNAGDSNGFGLFTQMRHDILFPLIINTSLNAVGFYGNALWLIPRFYRSQNRWPYVFALILASTVFVLLKTSAEKLYIHYHLPDLDSEPIAFLVQENLITLPIFVVFSIIFFIYKKNKDERTWLIQEKLQRELALLKAQMSPHFLFNALNNIYSLGIQGKHERVNVGVLKLSGLLRYIIYDSQANKILLSKELEYIGDFIEVSKLMFRDDGLGGVQFNVTGDPQRHMLPPLILVTFVENAFKYGMGGDCGVDIRILAEIKSGKLHFSVRNKICQAAMQRNLDVQHHGIGIHNVRRQLNILYKDRYILSTQSEGDHFDVNLEMTL